MAEARRTVKAFVKLPARPAIADWLIAREYSGIFQGLRDSSIWEMASRPVALAYPWNDLPFRGGSHIQGGQHVEKWQW